MAHAFEAGTVLAVEGTGKTAGGVAAGDWVAREGANGGDLVYRGGEARLGVGVVGWGLERLALASQGLGGFAAAVGWGEVATVVASEPEANEGE